MEVARYLIGALCIVGICSTVLATLELRRMKLDSPQLLREVGIERVDWWFRCIAGVYRLAFGSPRRSMSTKRRLIFITLCVTYPLCVLLLILFPRAI